MKTLICNAEVLVMDGKTAAQEALVFENNRILGTGSSEAMKRLAGSDCRQLDAGGATVMPGIIDTHSHIVHFAAMFLPLLNITDAVNHDDIVQRIRKRAAETPKGQWIITTPVGEPHYFRRRSYRDLEERHLPDKNVLDRATTDHPVMIQAWGPIQPNVCAFNSAGLKAVHLSNHIPDVVSDVRFDKTPSGELTGILRGAVTSYLNFDPYWGQIQTKIMMQLGNAAGNFGAINLEALKDEIKKVLKDEFTNYEESITAAKDQAIESIKKTQTAIEEQRQILEKQLQEQVAVEKKVMMDKFESRMGEIVNHYILEAIGGELDIADQMDFIFHHLEANKQAIVEDITGGA